LLVLPLLKKVPVALWGESLTPSLNGNQFIENTLSGLEIKPKKQPDTWSNSKPLIAVNYNLALF
jgi:hypothetical protein